MKVPRKSENPVSLSSAVRSFPIILILVLSLTNVANGQSGVFQLSESSLIDSVKQSNPRLKDIKAQLEASNFQTTSFDERFQWNVTGKVSHSDSNEKAIAAFFPTFGPTYRYETGLNKKLKYGVQFDAGVFVDQQSTTNKVIDQATRTGVTLGFSVDLWRNLFGRIDRAQYSDMNDMNKRSQLQADINSKVVMLEMRKLYWSIVANDLQTKITQQLLKTSQNQLNQARKRGQQFIADKGEIARYRAQVNSRVATIKSLEYQRDLLIQSLKQSVPHLSSNQIRLAPVDLDKNYVNIYKCAQKIGAYKEIPWDNTKIDEILSLVESSYKSKRIVTNRYSDVDLKLSSRLQNSGVDKGYSDSFDDFSGNGQIGYQVAIELSLPLGSSRSKSKQSQESVDYNRFLSEKNQLLGQAQAKHTQIVSMVGLLKQAVESLKRNGDNLATSIRVSKRKFKQARISINDLIAEQDALLNSRLSEVDTKLQVIHTLLDYFQTFTEDDCNSTLIGAL